MQWPSVSQARTLAPARLAVPLATLLAVAGCAPPQPSIPVVLVSLDTLRPDHLGCYGYPRPTSPNLDAFRADAVLYSSAFAHAPSTLPSHASMLTSLLPPHHGASIARDLGVPNAILTLTEVLHARGYATASFNGGVQLDRAYGLDQGFDVYESVRPRDEAAESLAGAEDGFAHTVDRASDFVSRQLRPAFFLFLHSYEVHHPYTPAAADLAPFRGGYSGPLPDRISVALLEQINAGKLTLSGPDYQHVVDAYDAEIHSADRAFGDLVAFLKKKRLYDASLIIVTSDHGEEFSEHGRLGWHSHTLFDELLKVPLLVKLPGRRLAGTTASASARGIDIAPTVLHILGIPVPASFEGRDLLAPEVANAPRETFSCRDVPQGWTACSLRTPEWKLVGRRLYDLRNDPAERENVAAEHPEVVGRLSERRGLLFAARPQPPGRRVPVGGRLRKRLRGLGYLE